MFRSNAAASPQTATMAADVRARARHVAERADHAMASIGESMTGAARKIRTTAPPRATIAADRTSRSLERAGAYLKEHHVQDVAHDAAHAMGRHPFALILGGTALGWWLARRHS